jgi:hypothetical protein
MALIRDLLQNLVANGGIVEFLPNWQRRSALRRFAAFIANQQHPRQHRRHQRS